MTDKRTQSMAEQSNMEKDPKDWVTGDEPMTGAQRSYLKTLCEEAKQPFDENLSKADASRRIDELQAITGRGQHGQQRGDERGDGDQQDGRATAAVETVVSR
ncbi:DUF3072 domain-containing protein [Ramlibacter henchirensis]|uniref:DUF3072 domain-containing protein n=1 Tax=Ramlibacter henchirensis TaxID=204072 RepID=A0A4Z0C4V6_9BURK|nr:DUF3072 domain-containing protein [Ramlibacter henchirensis]TFZ06767.1 DUF3072 domain-containing protein [Ramlibacter henchirensis]